jgi:hypothetical protein
MRYDIAIFSRCLFCHAAISENETFEGMTRGQRFAFDPARGRLWVICDECKRWNLVPIEERWETVESLEKIARDEARLMVKTENVSLLRIGDVELIRIGAAGLPEEAWWRYGREITSRRAEFQRYNLRMGRISSAVAMSGVTLARGAIIGIGMQPVVRTIMREMKFGPTAWRGAARCAGCGSVLREIHFDNTKRVIIARGENGALELRYRCYRCQFEGLHAGYRLTGISAEHLLRRVLAYRHFDGATESHIRASSTVIEEIGSPDQLTQRLALQRVHLGELPRPYTLALEIALNELTERKLLQLELKELEARWLEEEKLARIVDDELTFVPSLIKALPEMMPHRTTERSA